MGGLFAYLAMFGWILFSVRKKVVNKEPKNMTQDERDQ